MTDTQEVPVKPWYTSHVMWAAMLAGVLPALGQLIGHQFTAADIQSAADLLSLAGGAVAAGWAMYQRFKSTSVLTKGKPK